LPAKRQECRATPMSHEPEEANTNKPGWKGVQQKTSQELLDRKGHQLLLASVGIIFPAKSNTAIRKRNQSVVGYGNTMRIARQIIQNMVGSTKRRLGVDNPLVLMQGPQERLECFLIGERLQFAGQAKLALPECAFETGDKFAAEDAA